MEAKIISHQKARRMVSDLGWRMIRQGKVSYSRDMRWQVWNAGYLYKCRPCSPTW